MVAERCRQPCLLEVGICAGCPLRVACEDEEACRRTAPGSVTQPISGQVGRPSLLRGLLATTGFRRGFPADSRAGSLQDAREAGGRCMTKMPICRYFYGSDGTRTRDLRRDRPVLPLAGCAGIGEDSPQEQGPSDPAAAGIPRGRRELPRSPAGSVRDAVLSG